MFYPRKSSSGKIHPSAAIAPSAAIGHDVEIAAGAVIGEFAVIGARCRIAANAVIGDGVSLGDNCSVGPNTSISHALIGKDVTISSNVTIGGEGFGFVPGPERVQAVDVEKEIVIIDDGSTDGTCALLEQISQSSQQSPAVFVLPSTGRQLRTDNIRVLMQEKNQGKGAALRRGMKDANGETILIQDADLEYDPEDYHGLPKLPGFLD